MKLEDLGRDLTEGGAKCVAKSLLEAVASRSEKFSSCLELYEAYLEGYFLHAHQANMACLNLQRHKNNSIVAPSLKATAP